VKCSFSWLGLHWNQLRYRRTGTSRSHSDLRSALTPAPPSSRVADASSRNRSPWYRPAAEPLTAPHAPVALTATRPTSRASPPRGRSWAPAFALRPPGLLWPVFANGGSLPSLRGSRWWVGSLGPSVLGVRCCLLALGLALGRPLVPPLLALVLCPLPGFRASRLAPALAGRARALVGGWVRFGCPRLWPVSLAFPSLPAVPVGAEDSTLVLERTPGAIRSPCHDRCA